MVGFQYLVGSCQCWCSIPVLPGLSQVCSIQLLAPRACYNNTIAGYSIQKYLHQHDSDHHVHKYLHIHHQISPQNGEPQPYPIVHHVVDGLAPRRKYTRMKASLATQIEHQICRSKIRVANLPNL